MVIDVFAAESAVGLTPSAFQWAGQP